MCDLCPQYCNTYVSASLLDHSPLQDSAILDIVRQATHLEKSYRHYFDHYIPFEDLNAAYNDVVALATNLQSNQQWVPSAWVK